MRTHRRGTSSISKQQWAPLEACHAASRHRQIHTNGKDDERSGIGNCGKNHQKSLGKANVGNSCEDFDMLLEHLQTKRFDGIMRTPS